MSEDSLVPRPWVETADQSLYVRPYAWPRATHLVVLDLPACAIVVVLLPLLILWNGEECQLLLSLGRLDDWRDEFDEEVWQLEQTWVKGVQEVDDQTLDVTSIVILIRHNHETSVTQRVDIFIDLTVLETENLVDVGDFHVLHDLIVPCFAHVE